MARIRTIKPDFFSSEDITTLTPLSRLFFIALWCEADREGRFEYKPGTLKNRYFPVDRIDVQKLMEQLENQGLVKLYQPEGFPLLAWIPTFTKHQMINNREAESTFPPFSDDISFTRESGVKAEGRKEGKERKEREGSNSSTTRDVVDPLFHAIMKSFQAFTPRFANYQKESVCTKKIMASAKNLCPDDPEGGAKLLLTTYHRLTSGTDRFWSGQPFTPSGLSPLVERVWAEANKGAKLSDLSWIGREGA